MDASRLAGVEERRPFVGALPEQLLPASDVRLDLDEHEVEPAIEADVDAAMSGPGHVTSTATRQAGSAARTIRSAIRAWAAS